MPIPGGVLVAGGAARCLYSATGMLRFLARLSGRRRHVRRSFGVAPGGATAGAVSLLSIEPSSSSSSSSSSSPSSSCCFNTSTTTISSSDTVSKEPLTEQTFIDPIWVNERNSDLDDIKLRQCYLRCRRNIHSTPRQELLNESSSCTRERLMEITSTTMSLSSSVTSQELDDDSLSRIAGLRDESTTIMTSRRQQRRYLEEIDDNDAKVSLNMSNKSSNISSNNSSCCSSSSGSGKFWFSSTWLTNDENSGSTGVARYRRRRRIPSYLATLLFISYTLFGISEACSARSTPKPRPPTPTPRPNITFHMYTCPPDYAEWYCLNGATCFTVKIQESLLYNCLCANGFIGQRCEFKDLDGSYLPSRQRVMLETASIAGGATIAVFLVVIICIAAYIHCKRKQKEMRTSSTCVDTVDGPVRDPERRPFSNRNRPIMTFMAKNSNCNPGMCPSIEQTRMPGWNDYSQVELTRLASINEAKRSSQ